MASVRPAADIESVRRSHERMLSALQPLDDEAIRRPSLLPGWDIATILSHLAVHAISHAWAFEGARLGAERRRYPNPESRDGDIEAGRNLPARALIRNLEAASHRLEDAWDALPISGWAGRCFSGEGEPELLVDSPRARWREVDVHHADLGLGFSYEDWDERFVQLELDLWLPRAHERLRTSSSFAVTATDLGRTWSVGGRVTPEPIEGPSRLLLAWVFGRHTDGFPALGPWQW